MGTGQGQVVEQGPPHSYAEQTKIRMGNKAMALQTLHLMAGNGVLPRSSSNMQVLLAQEKQREGREDWEM